MLHSGHRRARLAAASRQPPCLLLHSRAHVESLAGLREPDAGTISVLGCHPSRDRAEVRERLGVQLQESSFRDAIKVAEALELYSSFYRAPADWRELIELLGLREKRNTQYAALSGGQKQRLSIALALVGNPRIAILDELTTELDPQARRDTWCLIERIRDTGVTILLVTHFMDEAERLCDRIAVIDGGRVAAVDTPAELIAQASDAGPVPRESAARQERPDRASRRGQRGDHRGPLADHRQRAAAEQCRRSSRQGAGRGADRPGSRLPRSLREEG